MRKVASVARLIAFEPGVYDHDAKTSRLTVTP